ncbi:hypothetical protein NA57DRAFT_80239 [Rhizodiscina lignyota]|uniref:Heterokaryon incompatibility domain-containing protein n=1 Tax=Rhizodiscina lignyota TaxID=1504668 RepID=A0A9P4I3R1_9PEZI|nr:hypothetical protein NA57DRAFT_80239 [Rhizodiscina lignyota]
MTSKNRRQMEHDLSWSLLPKTFQDAILVTLHLWMQYIWIDSLCIIQDDPLDWDREVYENATLGRVDYFSTGGDSGTPDACFSSWIEHYEHHFNDGPLSTRAWAYQEQLLARRFLSYDSYELLWECDSTWRCECGVGDALGQKFHPIILDPSWKPEMPNLLTEPAISGIAKRFQRKLHDRYVAGLWSNDFIEGILWERVLGLMSQRSAIMPTSYCAPSWSWASVLSPVVYSEFKLVRTYTQVVNVQCTPAGTDLTGRISAGAAILYGPLIEAWVRVGQGNVEPTEELFLYLDPDRESRATCRFVTDCPLAIEEAVDLFGQIQWEVRRIKNYEYDSNLGFDESANTELKEARVYCLYIGIRPADHTYGYRGSCALVLSRSKADPERFVRLGMSSETSEAHGELFRSAKNTTITII